MARPLCFVLMPFGQKPTLSGKMLDFDAIYRQLIAPAIEEAGLEPLRADEEEAGGFIHKAMFERLILCEYAVADLTTANANVLYELGVRHAVRPASTVLVFAAGEDQLPFDVAPFRGLPYSLGADGRPSQLVDRSALVKRLQATRDEPVDSPVYQLVQGFPDVQHLKTDVIRQGLTHTETMKRRLSDARRKGAEAVRNMERALGDVAAAESSVVLDLFLSYRAVSAWDEMIALAYAMAPPLAKTVMVREQLGLALNRAGRHDDAERVLVDLIRERGPSSETCGILGRVYKDRWANATRSGDVAAPAFLQCAIDAYLQGFETDSRDAYPGVNAVTLMEFTEPPDPRQQKLLAVVTYAVERRIRRGQTDYWDYATLIELAVLGGDEAGARSALAKATAQPEIEPWQPETTANNLKLIREARARRGQGVRWAEDIETELRRRAARK